MIKFRAWDKREEVMCEVISIDFQIKVVEVYYREGDMKGCKPFSEVILEQSTGLFDKNGKEIFEGDIVGHYHQGYQKGVVKMVDGVWAIDDNNESIIFEELCYEIGAGLGEVIGNIHEHKHLFEEGKYETV